MKQTPREEFMEYAHRRMKELKFPDSNRWGFVSGLLHERRCSVIELINYASIEDPDHPNRRFAEEIIERMYSTLQEMKGDNTEDEFL